MQLASGAERHSGKETELGAFWVVWKSSALAMVLKGADSATLFRGSHLPSEMRLCKAV